MKLLIKINNDEIVQVTKNNIIGFNDAIELLIAKRKIVCANMVALQKELDVLNQAKESEAEQRLFAKSDSIADIFNKRIISLPMNQVAINDAINSLKVELKNIRNEIREATRINNDIINSIYKDVLKYAIEFGLGDKETISQSYLFTSNLKELSGAVLHKTVFAFRLAYINIVRDILNIRLPIILDSPTGKEIDQDNIKLMINVLKRDFYEHQIIIASIYEYDFESVNKIELENKLISM